MTPEMMAGAMADITGKYPHVRIIGGCCGTSPEHIGMMRRVIDGLRVPCHHTQSVTSRPCRVFWA